MNLLNEFFSSDFASILTAITIRHSILLIAVIVFLVLARRLSSSLRVLFSFWAIVSFGLIALLQFFFPRVEWQILPSSKVVIEEAAGSTVEFAAITFEEITAENQTSEIAVSEAPMQLDLPLLIWSLGALSVIGYWLKGRNRLARLLDQAEMLPAEHALSVSLSGLISSKYREGSSIRLFLSKEAKLPFTCGAWKPAIILPADAMGWSAERLRMVFLHEIAHIERRDIAAQFFINLTLALQWFNPMVWLAYRIYMTEREQACDDYVLRSGYSASDYGECLIHFVKVGRMPKYFSKVGLAMAASGTIETRLRAILDSNRRRDLAHLKGGVAAIVSMFCVAAPLGLVQLNGKSLAPLNEETVYSELDQSSLESEINPVKEPRRVVVSKDAQGSVVQDTNEKSKRKRTVIKDRKNSIVKLSTELVSIKPNTPLSSELKAILNEVGLSYPGSKASIEKVSVVSSQQHDKILRALSSTAGVDRIGAPTVSVQSGNAAKVSIGQNLRYSGYEIDGTVVRFDEFKKENMGFDIRIASSIQSADEVTLEVNAQQTELERFFLLDEKSLKPGYVIESGAMDASSVEQSKIDLPILKRRGRVASASVASGDTLCFWLDHSGSLKLSGAAGPLLGAFDIADQILFESAADSEPSVLVLIRPDRVQGSGPVTSPGFN